MKEDTPVNNRFATLMERLRFKSLPYDEKSSYQRLKERMDKTVPFSYPAKESYLWRYLFVAASVALLLVSGLYFMEMKQTEPPQLVYYETTAALNAKTKLTLPDSTTVWLNANASLRYPREFSGAIREVEVSGEAFFDVRKDTGKPFIVRMEGMHIQVLGTSFFIDTETAPDLIEVTLQEGEIALFSDQNVSGIADLTLHPGQQALFRKSANGLTVVDIQPWKYTSWITGVFVFEGNTLEEIAGELQRAFHVKIHIENETMRNKTFNAVFTEKETLYEILSVLQISAQYKMESKRGEIYLK